jgi:predicted O-methyltransferase YrrM
MVFVDAAKAAYPDYLKAVYPLLRTGGLLIADDILADGDYNSEAKKDGTKAEQDGLAKYARAVANSPKLFSALMGTQTGLLVSVKT